MVIDEFRRLIETGYRELVLTGVMIGNYRDGSTGLSDLVASLLAIPGEFRVHLASISPASVSPELIGLLGHEKMVRHLNLSLQSGSDAVLAVMNRRYTSEQYRSLVRQIRDAAGDFNLTTDVIVGFPGESEADFCRTMELIRDTGFSHIHTFRYSPRPGTASHAMNDDVPEEIKKERSERIHALSMEEKKKYYRRFHGRESVILTEKSRRGKTRGFNNYYVPIEMDGAYEPNRLMKVITSFEDDTAFLRGSPS
jgi:threonylcarbamoyladenosine tRNA methylthiotransferase MtaB